jgi:L-rhamnose mutarotase
MMARVAFQLKLRKGAAEAYEAAHRAVWPEMLALLARSGIREYSIFRRDQILFLYMHVDDFESAWSKIEHDPVNQRWQAEMAQFFEPAADLRSGERFAMMQEVFYMP